ncbi:competence protein CoiA family protein [Microcella sp.]|uniref:competence protein CoiA family protein n=1 Tax=Microcella sp. TaxID=1913979 RepID=UPI00391A1EB8
MTEEDARAATSDALHSRSFLDRESQRFIAAAWRDDPDRPFYVLRDGDADRDRELAQTLLRCVVSDCPSPAITTVARKHSRQGFRHNRAGNHSPEGFHHLQGKAVIADWLRRMPGGLKVELEQSVDTQRRRRARVADVMATDPRTGHRTAFEVQYASISVDEWRERTNEYVAEGIGIVWVFGHVGVHMRARRGDDWRGTTLQVGAVHAAASARQGLPALWLNPAAGLLAVATTHLDELLVHREAGRAQLTAFPLDEVTLAEGRLVSNRFAAMANREREAAEQAEAARRREEALALQRREWKAKRIEEWQKARERVETQMRQANLRPKRDGLLSMSRTDSPRALPSNRPPQPRPVLDREQRGLPPEGSAYAELLGRIAHRYHEGTMYTKRDVLWQLWRAVAENRRNPLAPRCMDCGRVLGSDDVRVGAPRHRTLCGKRSPLSLRTRHAGADTVAPPESLAELLGSMGHVVHRSEPGVTSNGHRQFPA